LSEAVHIGPQQNRFGLTMHRRRAPDALSGRCDRCLIKLPPPQKKKKND